MKSSDFKESRYFILADASRSRFVRLADEYNAQFAESRNGGESLKYIHALIFDILLYQAIDQNNVETERPQVLVRTVSTDRKQIQRILKQNRSSVKLPKVPSLASIYRYIERLIEADIIEEKFNHAHLSYEIRLSGKAIALWDIKAEKAVDLEEGEEISKSDLYALQLATCKEDRSPYRPFKKIKSGLPQQSENKDESASGLDKIDLPENEEQGKPKKPESNSAAPDADFSKKNEKSLAEKAAERSEVTRKAAIHRAALEVLLFLLGHFFSLKKIDFKSLHSAELHTSWSWIKFVMHDKVSHFKEALLILELEYFTHCTTLAEIDAEVILLKKCIQLAKIRLNATPTEKRKALNADYLTVVTYLKPGRFSLRKVRAEWLPKYMESNQKRKALKEAKLAENEKESYFALLSLRIKQIANAVICSKNDKASQNAMFYIQNAYPTQFQIDYANLITQSKPIKVKPDRAFTSIVLDANAYFEENAERYIARFNTDYQKSKFHLPNRQMWKFGENNQIVGFTDFDYFKKLMLKRYHNLQNVA